MKIKCDHCQKEIDRKPSYIQMNLKKGHKNYCDRKCQYEAQNKQISCNCAYCNAPLNKMPCEIKNSKSGRVFCNKSCACSYNNIEYRTQENNPNWIDGTSKYVDLAFSYYEPECVICNYNNKHALQVHHLDKVRTNNELSNLMILCANCHSLVHRAQLKITQKIKKQRKLLNKQYNKG